MVGVRVITLVVAAVLGGAMTAAAQPTFPGADELAAAIVAADRGPSWVGARTPHPTERARPHADYALPAALAPLTVHATRQVPVERAAAALEALESAAQLLRAGHWPAPLFDGGRGGTSGFDLYLAPGPRDADAFPDAPVEWSYLDAVSAHAVVDPRIPDEALPACVAAAYTQAILLEQDPAEAATWRRATGDFVAWLLTGRFGCSERVLSQQSEPFRSWISDAAGDGEGGALFLSMLGERFDGGSGVFVRELWQFARQRTWDGEELRASPDLWEVLEVALDMRDVQLRDLIEDLAVERWFANDRPELPPDAVPPLSWRVGYEALPAHTAAAWPAIEPYGSAYGIVDVSSAPADARLRVWLRGEYGVAWSLITVRLDAAGRELGRVSAPPMRRPSGYVPLELGRGTDRVLVIATNMSSRRPDADLPDENVRSVRLIVDRGEGEEGAAGGRAPAEPSREAEPPPAR